MFDLRDRDERAGSVFRLALKLADGFESYRSCTQRHVKSFGKPIDKSHISGFSKGHSMRLRTTRVTFKFVLGLTLTVARRRAGANSLLKSNIDFFYIDLFLFA
jgi:hypothetical protein